MTKSIERRIEKIESQLCIGDKPVVFEYTDENGIAQKVEMLSTDFDKLLQEIDGKSKGLLVNESITV